MKCLNYLIVLLSVVAGTCIHASVTELPDLGEPEFHDLEINKIVEISPFEHNQNSLRVVNIELSISGSNSSNALFVVISSASNTNGLFEYSEMNFQIGINRGRWYLRDGDLKNVYTCEVGDTAAVKNFKMQIRLNAMGTPISVKFFEGNEQEFNFPGLDLSSPDNISTFYNPSSFRHCKFLRRGHFPEGTANPGKILYSRNGVKFIIR